MIGETLAHYEVLEKIGQGGMGTVYRARDTKLDRDVALKFLPSEMNFDPERAARFEREAKTLASLNHPNIAGIFGFEEDGERRFLAMELVEGEDLSERLSHGAIPRAEALEIARQIADGLEEAHEQGIVHRDLKPANIKLAHDGKVKILDFGLARAYQGGGVNESSVSDSPTITAMTQVGVILGTAAYMSPEQAKGKPVDRRADLWAFGVILWEMLTGKRLFDGEDASDTLAAVLRQETPWEDLPADTPPRVQRLLERCLERDPRKRLRDIGETRIRLEEWTRDPSSLVMKVRRNEEAPPAWRRLLPWGVAMAAVLAAVFFALRPGPGTAGEDDLVTRPPRAVLDILMPGESPLSTNAGINVQISPLGTQIAYRTAEGVRIRPIDQRESRLLSGTEGTVQFTFSPDGKWIAFLANGSLQRVSTSGGAPSPITKASLVSRGLSWVNESTLVYAPNFFDGLFTVSLTTGEVHQLTDPDSANGERSHRWPSALPDGNAVLFLCQFEGEDYDEGEVRMVNLDGEVKTVYKGGAAPQYARSGHLLFAQDQTIFALPFDPVTGKTRGLGIPALTNVWSRVNDQEADDGSAQYFVSPQGTLIYRTQGVTAVSKLMRLDLDTGWLDQVGEATNVTTVALSADGRHLAAHVIGEGTRLIDTESGMHARFTFSDRVERVGAFTRDSRQLFWMRAVPDGSYEIWTRPVDGSVQERLVATHHSQVIPKDISPDGKAMLLQLWNNDDQWDVGMMDLEDPNPEIRIWVGGDGAQVHAKFSMDGKWIAYVGADDGARILLRRFPDTGVQWEAFSRPDRRLSFDWVEEDSAILVRSSTGFYRIPMDISGETPRIGSVELMSDTWVVAPPQVGSNTSFSADARVAYGMDLVSSDGVDDRLVLDTDWFSELRRLAPIQ